MDDNFYKVRKANKTKQEISYFGLRVVIVLGGIIMVVGYTFNWF